MFGGSKAVELQLQMRQNEEELHDFVKELDCWETDIKRRDEELRGTAEEPLPIRNKDFGQKKKTSQRSTKDTNNQLKQSRIKSYDYQSWDKFDVDKALESMDKEESPDSESDSEDYGMVLKLDPENFKAKNEIRKIKEVQSQQSAKMDRRDAAEMKPAEAHGDQEAKVKEQRVRQEAVVQKDLGNAYFREGKYEAAVECYTRGMQADATNALLPANRAMAYLKLQRYTETEEDCSRAIALDATYTKAFARRGSARAALGKLQEARQDFEQVLKLEPGNKHAMEELLKISADAGGSVLTSEQTALDQLPLRRTVQPINKPQHHRSTKPLRRIEIEEVGGEPLVLEKLEAPPCSALPITVAGDDGKGTSPLVGSPSAKILKIEILDSPAQPQCRISEKGRLEAQTMKRKEELTSQQTPPPSESDDITVPSVPVNSFQLEADLKKLKNQPEMMCKYVKQMEPDVYPRVLQNSLEPDILNQIPQMERDEIHTFWEITKRQMAESKAELRNKDREMEELEMRDKVEMKDYEPKVKHLYYETQNDLTEQKMEAVVNTKTMQMENAEEEDNLCKNMHTLKMDLKEQELRYEKLLQRQEQDEEMSKLRQDCDTLVRDIEKKYEMRMKALQEEVDLRHKMEIHEIEEQKNRHIDTLIKNHNKAVSDMKTYYHQTIANNLGLNNALEQQLKERSKEVQRLEEDMAELTLQNRSLTEPLQKAKEEVMELQSQLADYTEVKASLAAACARLKVAHKNDQDLKWEHEALQQLFRKVKQERDELQQKFTGAVLEAQQKSGFEILQEQLRALRESLDKTDAQLKEVLSASANDTVTNELEDMKKKSKRSTKDTNNQLKQSQIKSYDYQSRDKFDVDMALESMDKDESPDSKSDSEDYGMVLKLDPENFEAKNEIRKIKEAQSQQSPKMDRRDAAEMKPAEVHGDQEAKVKEQRVRQEAVVQKDLGNAYFREGKYEAAVECYTRGMQADATNALLPANRAMAYLKLQRYTETEEDCSRAIALDATYIKAFARRGSARAALGKLQEARQDFEQVLKLEPGNKHAMEELQKISADAGGSVLTSEQTALDQLPLGKTVQPINKPQHRRSTKPLRRIEIEEVGGEPPVLEKLTYSIKGFSLN